MTSQQPPDPEGANASTCWSKIRQGDLAYVVQRFWHPVHRFLRSRVQSDEEAEELTQELFLRFIEKDLITRPTPERGHFRQFLFHCARQFLIDHRRRQKHRAHQPLGATAEPPAGQESPEECFDREWYLQLFADARKSLKKLMQEQDKQPAYVAFRLFYFGSADGEGFSQKQVAETLGISVDQVNNHLRRARVLFSGLMRQSLRETCGGEPDAEVEQLSRFLQSHRLQGLPPSSILDPAARGDAQA